MTALRFQTGGRRQTSPASLLGEKHGQRDRLTDWRTDWEDPYTSRRLNTTLCVQRRRGGVCRRAAAPRVTCSSARVWKTSRVPLCSSTVTCWSTERSTPSFTPAWVPLHSSSVVSTGAHPAPRLVFELLLLGHHRGHVSLLQFSW